MRDARCQCLSACFSIRSSCASILSDISFKDRGDLTALGVVGVDKAASANAHGRTCVADEAIVWSTASDQRCPSPSMVVVHVNEASSLDGGCDGDGQFFPPCSRAGRPLINCWSLIRPVGLRLTFRWCPRSSEFSRLLRASLVERLPGRRRRTLASADRFVHRVKATQPAGHSSVPAFTGPRLCPWSGRLPSSELAREARPW